MNVLLTVALLCSGFASGFSEYEATAYCLKGKTASGMITRSGIIAADPRVLKLGTTVYIRAGRHSGEYIVRDTGRHIKGRRIDIWIKNRKEALQFGRRSVRVKIL